MSEWLTVPAAARELNTKPERLRECSFWDDPFPILVPPYSEHGVVQRSQMNDWMIRNCKTWKEKKIESKK